MTMPQPSVNVGGDVEGSIVVGDNNFVVNTNNGTIIYKQAAPRVEPRAMSPKPPRKPKSFIGREKELAQLEKWIADGQPIFLHGQPGLGKTTLAKQAANSPAAISQPNGVVFIEGVDEAGKALAFGDLVQQMFDALFESEPPLKVDSAAARTYLSNVRPLVYLSGISLNSTELDELSSLFPNTPVLVETEQTVSDDDYDDLPLSPFERSDSLLLLADRSGITLDSKSQPVLDEIANALGDIPGALTIIGNALKEKRLKLEDVPAGLNSVKPSTGDTVKAALSRAYRLVISTLSAEERAMLVETGSAPGISVDRKWLERGSRADDVSKKLESLQLMYANSPRMRLISGLREFVLEGQDDVVAKEKLLQHLEEQMQNKWRDFDFVKDELGNLLGLFDWVVSQRRWREAILLGRALDPFLTLTGRWESWRRVLADVYQAARALGDQAAQGWALHQIGTCEIGRGNWGAARKSLQQALKLRQRLGDSTGVAFTQHNLDFILHSPSPKNIRSRQSAGRNLGWIFGVGLVLFAAAVLMVGRAFGLPLPFVQPPTVTSSSTPTFTPSSTPSFTPSITSSPTSTFTFTPSPTETPTFTPIPTYAILRGELLDTAACYHGPGNMYLYKYGLRAGSNLEIIGRSEGANGLWLYVQAIGGKNPCWVNSKVMKVGGDVASLEPVYPDKAPLPGARNYPPPTGVIALRNGDQVTVSWDFATPIPLSDRESANSPYYLVELWTCQQGQIVFTPIGAFDPTVTVTDEPGCSQPSHGRVFLSDIDGYDGPIEIPWPKRP
ncbi:MAG: hypothetical protein HYR70_13320 [Chloroflexi bacterium]|nr:hypothetical protein [Chloroflexota bacterium]MBI3339611.1 hypothetical protein [Chloroflexota bacterium]